MDGWATLTGGLVSHENTLSSSVLGILTTSTEQFPPLSFASRRTCCPADSSESHGFRDTRTRSVLGTATNARRETVALSRSRESRSGLRSRRGRTRRRHDGRPATMRHCRASSRRAGDGSGPVYRANPGAGPAAPLGRGPRAALDCGVCGRRTCRESPAGVQNRTSVMADVRAVCSSPVTTYSFSVRTA